MEIRPTTRIDPHTHSDRSDGRWPIERIIAAVPGWMLAITDHNVLVPAALRAFAKDQNVTLIPGIEFSCQEVVAPDQPSHYLGVHILGYGVDDSAKTLREKTEQLMQSRRVDRARLETALEDNGLAFESTFFRPQSIPRPFNYAGAVVGLEKNQARLLELFGKSQNYYLAVFDLLANVVSRDSLIAAGEAVSLITQSGGLAFLAHPCHPVFGWLDISNGSSFKTFIERQRECGLVGLEYGSRNHSLRQTQELLAFAEEQGLAATIGSDFHGKEAEIIGRVTLRTGEEVEINFGLFNQKAQEIFRQLV